MARIVVALVLCLAVSRARAGAPSVDSVSRALIAESLAPVLEVVEREAPDAGIAVRADFSELSVAALPAAYADLLFERGYEVYELRGQQAAPEGALLLELRPRSVGVRYGRIERAFLGLGKGSQERTMVLELGLRLTEGDGGRLLFQEDRSLERVDWVRQGDEEPLAPGHPFYTAQKAGGQPSAAAPRVGWIERGVALGLMGGIIIVYFSASS